MKASSGSGEWPRVRVVDFQAATGASDGRLAEAVATGLGGRVGFGGGEGCAL
jgi:hypothetical protein